MSKSKKPRKQRYDLWIVRNNTIRLVSANKKAKACRKLADDVELNHGETFFMTPISSEVYCPLLSHRLAAVRQRA